jgi:hypothetical protein
MVRERNPKPRKQKMQQSEKLKNFPKVYYISLEESADRRQRLEDQFAEYGIKPTGIISKRWKESDDELVGSQVHTLNNGTKGSLVSHIKMIRKWYEETNDEWGFFCEDDLSLETVKYWNFTWDDLVKKIPENAQCVQMLMVTDNFGDFGFQVRRWDNWGATAYLLKRKHAERLVKSYCVSDKKFKVNLWTNQHREGAIFPLVENAIFAYHGDDYDGYFFDSMSVVYSIPLFVEDVWNCPTTFPNVDETGYDENLQTYPTAQKGQHYSSSLAVLAYWKAVYANNKAKNNE